MSEKKTNKVDRRKFLQTIAAGTVASIAVPTSILFPSWLEEKLNPKDLDGWMKRYRNLNTYKKNLENGGRISEILKVNAMIAEARGKISMLIKK